MNLLAPFDFEVTALTAVLEHLLPKLVYKVIGRVHCLFVVNFAVFQVH